MGVSWCVLSFVELIGTGFFESEIWIPGCNDEQLSCDSVLPKSSWNLHPSWCWKTWLQCSWWIKYTIWVPSHTQHIIVRLRGFPPRSGIKFKTQGFFGHGEQWFLAIMYSPSLFSKNLTSNPWSPLDLLCPENLELWMTPLVGVGATCLNRT